MKKFKKIVIYGGAFNPPHIGHMIAIEAALRNFKCDEIWVIPSAERLDKYISTSGKHRIKMLKIVLREFFQHSKIPIKISDLEISRRKLTTTFDTKIELEKQHRNTKFYFLIGSELLWNIRNKWVKGRELWSSAYFLAIRKPNAKMPPKLPPNIKLVDKDIIWLNISSTLVRSLIAKGYTGIPYTHPKVAEYIKKRGLYR